MSLKKATPLPFAPALTCFILPFISFSCDNLILENKTGFDLSTGFQQSYEKVTPNPLIIVYIATVLSAFVFSLLGFLGLFFRAAGGGAIVIITIVSFLFYIHPSRIESQGKFIIII